MFRSRPLRGSSMSSRRHFERNAAAGEILREAAPGGEVELIGPLELRQVAFQARAFRQQAEDAPLVEHVDLILPDHVVNGGKLPAIADQQRSQAGDTVSHQAACSGMGTASANPDRKTGWGNPSGATSGAAPTGVRTL